MSTTIGSGSAGIATAIGFVPCSAFAAAVRRHECHRVARADGDEPVEGGGLDSPGERAEVADRAGDAHPGAVPTGTLRRCGHGQPGRARPSGAPALDDARDALVLDDRGSRPGGADPGLCLLAEDRQERHDAVGVHAAQRRVHHQVGPRRGIVGAGAGGRERSLRVRSEQLGVGTAHAHAASRRDGRIRPARLVWRHGDNLHSRGCVAAERIRKPRSRTHATTRAGNRCRTTPTPGKRGLRHGAAAARGAAGWPRSSRSRCSSRPGPSSGRSSSVTRARTATSRCCPGPSTSATRISASAARSCRSPSTTSRRRSCRSRPSRSRGRTPRTSSSPTRRRAPPSASSARAPPARSASASGRGRERSGRQRS